jgi:glycosyltransferase involved in cell wall biosynthesis
MLRASVIIPALNEAERLAVLLGALGEQSVCAHEVIVADAGSTDGTRAIAAAAGGIVVDGGMPGVGRNAGAAVATGDLLVFLDADVRPDADFLECVTDEFERRACAVATCLIEPLEPSALNTFLAESANLYLQVMRPISPHAPGSCVLCLRSVHEAIGGFDESLKLAEDHDYVQRAAEHGDFSVLTSVMMPTSMRRVETEGLFALSLKYLWSEMHAITGRPIRDLPFEYEFGAHALPGTAGQPSRLAEEIARLRAQLSDLGDPFERLSTRARGFFDDLVERSDPSAARLRVRELLDASDIAVLERYLRRRLRALIPGDRDTDER